MGRRLKGTVRRRSEGLSVNVEPPVPEEVPAVFCEGVRREWRWESGFPDDERGGGWGGGIEGLEFDGVGGLAWEGGGEGADGDGFGEPAGVAWVEDGDEESAGLEPVEGGGDGGEGGVGGGDAGFVAAGEVAEVEDGGGEVAAEGLREK